MEGGAETAMGLEEEKSVSVHSGEERLQDWTSARVSQLRLQ